MKYLHNYISEEKDKKGYLTFSRFYPEQLCAYQNQAMLKAMSKSTAGMYLGFYMTGSKIAFECKKENRIKLILPIVRQVKVRSVTKMIKKIKISDFYPKKQKSMVDGIDFVVDDTLIETVKAKGKIHFQFDNPEHQPKKVRIFFPAIESLAIRNLRIQGSVTELEPKETMLCLGDSITQGLIAGGPSLNYVSLLADYLGLDALNQGVGGYTFEAESLDGLEKLPKPKLITVAYGTNDWTNKESLDCIRQDIMNYFERLTALFSDVPIFVLTPIWRADEEEQVSCRVPFDTIDRVIKEIVLPYKNMQIIEGIDLVNHDQSLYADSYLHPNAMGFAQMAGRISVIIKESLS